jgi:outer membrane protein assembly factor BamB
MPEHVKIKIIIGLIVGFIALPLLNRFFRQGIRTWYKTTIRLIILLLFLVDIAGLVIVVLMKVSDLELEWRGGYVPVVTWHKTRPDFDALDQRNVHHIIIDEEKPPAINGNWPGFRGPLANGEYTEQTIITNWTTNGLKLLWTQACGGGYSSFAVSGWRAFTLEQRREKEALVAYNIENGHELWSSKWNAEFMEYHSDEGPRTTPLCDEDKVYCLGATGELRCVEASNGAVVWSTNIVTRHHAALPDYGLAASPLIVDEKLIVQPDAYKGFSVVCYDKHNGNLLWHNLDLPMGYATPELVTIGGERQVVVCARPYIVGLRLSDGQELWRYEWQIINHERPITQPLLVNSNTFFVSAAYMTGCAEFQVTRDNDTWKAAELWHTKSMKAKFASPVLYKGKIYGLDEDILCCVDAATGEREWKDGRYGYGQVLLASGHLVVLCANGDLALVKAEPDDFHEIARFPALHGKTWNAPAIAAGRLLIRNNAEMACYQIVN